MVLYKNYKVFGRNVAARNILFISILATVLLLSVMLSIPDYIIEMIPSSLLPAIYTPIIVLIANKLQGSLIKEYIVDRSDKESGWKAFGYGILASVISLAIIIPLLFFASPVGYENSLSVDENITVYYCDEIKYDEALEIGKTAAASSLLFSAKDLALMLDKEDDKFMLRFVLLDTSAIEELSFLLQFNDFERYLNRKLNSPDSIKIGFIDKNLKNKYDLPMIPVRSSEGFSKELELNAHRVVGFCSTENIASRRVLEKCGMTREGIQRKNAFFHKDKDGRPVWLDSYQYAILAEDCI